MKTIKKFPAHEFDLEQMREWYKSPAEAKLQYLTDALYFFHRVREQLQRKKS